MKEFSPDRCRNYSQLQNNIWAAWLITVDETWINYSVSETKGQTKHWVLRGESEPKEARNTYFEGLKQSYFIGQYTMFGKGTLKLVPKHTSQIKESGSRTNNCHLSPNID